MKENRNLKGEWIQISIAFGVSRSSWNLQASAIYSKHMCNNSRVDSFPLVIFHKKTTIFGGKKSLQKFHQKTREFFCVLGSGPATFLIVVLLWISFST